MYSIALLCMCVVLHGLVSDCAVSCCIVLSLLNCIVLYCNVWFDVVSPCMFLIVLSYVVLL